MALPAYESTLSAYHDAFEDEIRRMIAVLPMTDRPRVADVGSGDGFYAGLLAERLGANGRLTCVDASDEYLSAARRHLAAHPAASRIAFRVGDVRRLPFEDGAFDFVWCAQSFYSFPHPVAALREMGRTLASGGTVAVMENDVAHQVLLPWPPDVEVLLLAAELEGLRERQRDADRYYIGRGLVGLFQAAGLEPAQKRTFAWDRIAPFDGSTRRFLECHVSGLRERVWPHLGSADRARCAPLLDPSSGEYILGSAACNATVIDHVLWGRRPGTAKGSS